MFTSSSIISAGSDLVGWRQSANSAYTTLDAELTTSQSGLYVNALPGVDFDMIENMKGEDWADTNTYLKAVHQDEITNLVTGFVNSAKSKLTSRHLLSNFDVVNGVADYTNLATKAGRFVGWVIKPHESLNTIIDIKKIGLQLSASQNLTIYLYETSQQAAVASQSVSYTSALSLQWFTLTGFQCSYRGTYGSRQQYILGYFEDDLTGSSVKFDFDCGCDNAPSRQFGKYVGITPISIETSKLNGVLLPSTYDLTSYYDDASYGLYAKINVTCDITDVILDNIDVFSKAMQYAVAIRIMDDYISSKRINAITDHRKYVEATKEIKAKYYAYLHGWVDDTGFKHRGIIDDITIDFSGMDAICLPCKDGIKIGTMGRP